MGGVYCYWEKDPCVEVIITEKCHGPLIGWKRRKEVEIEKRRSSTKKAVELREMGDGIEETLERRGGTGSEENRSDDVREYAHGEVPPLGRFSGPNLAHFLIFTPLRTRNAISRFSEKSANFCKLKPKVGPHFEEDTMLNFFL